MRKRLQSLDTVKNKIMSMSGKSVRMSVCRGRKQIKRYSGVIENTFPSVFVVRITENTANIMPCLSYSYNDVLCGEVKIDEEVV